MSNKIPDENNTDERPSKESPAEEEIVCAICKESDNPELFTFLICAHGFHTYCVTPWLEISRCCPLCKTIVRDEIPHEQNESDLHGDQIGDFVQNLFEQVLPEDDFVQNLISQVQPQNDFVQNLVLQVDGILSHLDEMFSHF